MPSSKAIRTRIASVKSTQKITRAMKQVAAAKLRRAQDSIVAARPYAARLKSVVAELGAPATPGAGASTAIASDEPGMAGAMGGLIDAAGEFEHPLLRVRPERRSLLVLMTSDRGLCGGFNTNVQRATERWIDEHRGQREEIGLHIVGRKGREYFRRRRASLIGRTWPAAMGKEVPERARVVATDLIADYVSGKFDAVHVVYNEFKSAITQRVRVERLLPIEPDPELAGGHTLDFVFEPSRRALFDAILPLYVQIEIQRILLESIASEFGAKMSAMDSATRNATEMIASLTLQFNRARQAAITKELMEIIGGAEALKG